MNEIYYVYFDLSTCNQLFNHLISYLQYFLE